MHVKCRPSDRVRFDAPAESLRATVVVHLHRVHRPDRREQRPARAVPARLPDREGGDAGRVQGQTGRLAQEGVHIFYALLGLSVLVSMFGVISTIVLSVFERTREIGMLRAVGMTRRQLRRMIRHESIVTALIGAALGMAV